jgi:hypothetical protein
MGPEVARTGLYVEEDDETDIIEVEPVRVGLVVVVVAGRNQLLCLCILASWVGCSSEKHVPRPEPNSQ